MKKILIPAFFVGMILLTYVIATATTSMRMDDENIRFETYKHELSDNEIAKINYTRPANNQLPTDGRDIIDCYDVKEIRTKKFFGWNLKVDTLKSYLLIEEKNK